METKEVNDIVSEMFLHSKIVESFPATVRQKLEKLSKVERLEFIVAYQNEKKSLAFAYVLLIFLFAHYFYLRKWGLLVIFLFTGGGFMVWWFIDLFRLPSLIKSYNHNIAYETMRYYEIMYWKK